MHYIYLRRVTISDKILLIYIYMYYFSVHIDLIECTGYWKQKKKFVSSIIMLILCILLYNLYKIQHFFKLTVN